MNLKKRDTAKIMKFNQPEVLLGLLSTREGLPIGYQLFPGSQYEGNALEKAIEKIKEKYED